MLHEARPRRRGSRLVGRTSFPSRFSLHRCESLPARAGADHHRWIDRPAQHADAAAGDVVKDLEAAVIDADGARALSIELATIPVTSSAGGFVYRFNRSLAVVERASDSFGPFFAERAARRGVIRCRSAWTLRYAEYTQLDGYQLDEGTFITAANVREGERRPFSVDRLSLRMTTRQITGFGNYGITDRIDVGVARAGGHAARAGAADQRGQRRHSCRCSPRSPEETTGLR